DGVPGNADSTDQDFALVVYNGESKGVPVASIASFTLAGGAGSNPDPGETVTMQLNLGDLSPVPLQGGHGILSTTTPGVTVTSGSSDFPDVTPGQSVLGLTPFVFTVDKSVPCGTAIQFAL